MSKLMKLKSLISSEPMPGRWNKSKNKDIQITFKAGFGNDDSDDDLVIGNKNQSRNKLSLIHI